MSEWKFDWKRFQKHNKYTDEEMETFMNDPVRAKAAPMLFSPAILKKNMIIEVVESHGCSAGQGLNREINWFSERWVFLTLRSQVPGALRQWVSLAALRTSFRIAMQLAWTLTIQSGNIFPAWTVVRSMDGAR